MKIKRVRAYLSRAVPRTIDEKYLRFLDMRHILGAPAYAFGEVINNAKSRLISYRTWQSLGKLTAQPDTHPQTSTDGDELCRSFPNVFGPLACWTACCYKTRRRRLRLSWILVTGPRQVFHLTRYTFCITRAREKPRGNYLNLRMQDTYTSTDSRDFLSRKC